MSNINFVISSNPINLADALVGLRSATVEAEYGDVVVKGSALTMAHHGPRTGQQCPCSYDNNCAGEVEIVGVSHFDLDTLGGCAAILGRKPEAATFWALAEFVDLNGAHKLGQSGASEEDLRRLHAFWAWSEKVRVYAPRDGSAVEITDKVIAGCEAVEQIVAGDKEMLKAGDVWKANGEKLSADSFVEAAGGVIARVAAAFVNHLYVDPQGNAQEAVVAYSTTTGAITISFADAPKGKSACEIVQSLWGELAGGHAGIAGSPRDRRMSLKDFSVAVEATRAALC